MTKMIYILHEDWGYSGMWVIGAYTTRARAETAASATASARGRTLGSWHNDAASVGKYDFRIERVPLNLMPDDGGVQEYPN